MDLSNLKHKTAVFILIAFTFIVYANSLLNSFVWDDYVVIVDNNFIKSWKNIPLLFSKKYLWQSTIMEEVGLSAIESSGELSYRPVVTFINFVDYFFWRLNPFGYHLTNLILHIFNIILLYFLINLIARNKKTALLTSLLFAVHPVNTERVACIAFRADLLVLLFFISSFILFIKLSNYSGLKRVFIYISSVILYLLALFSKEMAITLPLVLVLYDYFIRQEKTREIIAKFKSRYSGYIVATIFYLLVFFFIIGNTRDFLTPYPGGNFLTNIFTMSKVVTTYIRWLFVPVGIHPTLGYPFIIHSLFRLDVLAAISLIIASITVAFTIRNKYPLHSFAIFWFFVTLLPVTNIFPIGNIMASRYLYIPSVGFCILIASSVIKLRATKNFKEIRKDITIVVLAFYVIFTTTGILFWRNNITLWLELLRYYPNDNLIYRNLGVLYANIDKYNKAISYLNKAIEINSRDALSFYELGIVYSNSSDYEKAIASYKKAIEICPNLAQAYLGLGVIYHNSGNINEAINYYHKSLEVYPDLKEAYFNLAIAYMAKGQYEIALQYAHKAKELGFNEPSF
jgi:hypothetical protein